MREAGARDEPIFVFADDGMHVFPSVGDAAAYMEGVDIEDGAYEALFMLDGRIVEAAPDGWHGARLTVTDQRDEAELERRLRAHLAGVGTPADGPLDRRALMNKQLRWEWEYRFPSWPRWLHRRLYGDRPTQV